MVTFNHNWHQCLAFANGVVLIFDFKLMLADRRARTNESEKAESTAGVMRLVHAALRHWHRKPADRRVKEARLFVEIKFLQIDKK